MVAADLDDLGLEAPGFGNLNHFSGNKQNKYRQGYEVCISRFLGLELNDLVPKDIGGSIKGCGERYPRHDVLNVGRNSKATNL